MRSNEDPGETDDPLEGRVIRYHLTTAQITLNPPLLVVVQVVGVAVSCGLVWLAWEFRTVGSAWVPAALWVLLLSATVCRIPATPREGRAVRFQRAGADGPDPIVWEFDTANPGELSGRVPLEALRRDRGMFGTVVLLSISGKSAFLPTSVYRLLVARGMPDVPTRWPVK